MKRKYQVEISNANMVEISGDVYDINPEINIYELEDISSFSHAHLEIITCIYTNGFMTLLLNYN